ncbi:hypothetical protein D3C78_1472910 [compost metagenome]
MAGRCRAETPPASHTMPCTDSRNAQASGCSAWSRLAPPRWPRVRITAVAQAPITAMGSHTTLDKAGSKSSHASSRSSRIIWGDKPRQIRLAPAPAISRPDRKRRITSGPST